MALCSTEAVVLRTYKLADADKIVLILTQQAGLLRGVGRGARKLKSRFGAGLEPFTLIWLSYFEQEGRELVSLREAEILNSYFTLAPNVEVVRAMAYLSELVIEFAPPHEPNRKLFRLVKTCFAAMAQMPRHSEPIARYFELWLLRLSGFLPDLLACSNCRAQLRPSQTRSQVSRCYLVEGRSICCSECAPGREWPLSTTMLELLAEMLCLGPLAWSDRFAAVSGYIQEEISSLTSHLIIRILERSPKSITST